MTEEGRQGAAATEQARLVDGLTEEARRGAGVADEGGGRRRGIIAAAALSCVFLGMLDGTVTGTAMPRIVEQLGGAERWYVWVVTAYLLTSTVTVPLYGRFSDLYGRRAPLLTGLGLFLAGSLGSGLAASLACAQSLLAAHATGLQAAATHTAATHAVVTQAAAVGITLGLLGGLCGLLALAAVIALPDLRIATPTQKPDGSEISPSRR